MKLGVLGGTFDPIHNGHLAVAAVAMSCAGLERVLLVPSAQPPHRAPSVASAEARLEMVRLAIRGDERFEVSDVEVRRRGPSYTADTLAQLHGERPSDELTLILGWDAAKLFPTWRDPERVTSLARILVVRRPGVDVPGPADLRRAGLDSATVAVCLEPTPDIAGSGVRQALAEGRSIADSVPPAVAAYITDHKLYGG